MIEGLGWEGLGTYDGTVPAALLRYIAPSWSWASYNGIAAISGSDWTDVATVLDYHTSQKGTNLFGRLINGWVRIRGPLIPLDISDVPDDEAGPGRWRMLWNGGNAC